MGNLNHHRAFRALYIGQEVQVNPSGTITPSAPKKVNCSSFSKSSLTNGSYLSLKPLSSISDEDAIELSRVLFPNWKKRFVERDLSYWHNKDLMMAIENDNNGYRSSFYITHSGKLEFDFEIDFYLMVNAIDFLRSKEFILPFLHYSVEDILSNKWAVLSEE